MAAPQLGPGKAARFEAHQRDDGRFRVTGDPADAYAFRTPMLRNVAETGPWGHAGGHTDLRDFVAFHADPRAGLEAYLKQATLVAFEQPKPDWAVLEDTEQRAAIAAEVKGAPVMLDDADLDALMAFLAALTDEASIAGRLGIPDAVPSGLEIDR